MIKVHEIDNIEIRLNMKDGRQLSGTTNHPIIKNIMAQHVKYEEVSERKFYKH